MLVNDDFGRIIFKLMQKPVAEVIVFLELGKERGEFAGKRGFFHEKLLMRFVRADPKVFAPIEYVVNKRCGIGNVIDAGHLLGIAQVKLVIGIFREKQRSEDEKEYEKRDENFLEKDQIFLRKLDELIPPQDNEGRYVPHRDEHTGLVIGLAYLHEVAAGSGKGKDQEEKKKKDFVFKKKEAKQEETPQSDSQVNGKVKVELLDAHEKRNVRLEKVIDDGQPEFDGIEEPALRIVGNIDIQFRVVYEIAYVEFPP